MTIENWLYGVIALHPDKQDNYQAFMTKQSESEQYLHFTNKMSELLTETRTLIDT